jgi:Nucleotidyl transferase AbiEii toxin, Type IV TA system
VKFLESRLYPTALEEIEPWRRAHTTTAEEARRRFTQFVILEAVASLPALARDLTFKGGNALRFVYGHRRSTLDLDFTAVAGFPDEGDAIKSRLNAALPFALSRYRIKARCQRVRRNPPGKDKTWPTYDISVGYAFPADRLYKNFEEIPTLPAAIDVEISLNEVVCGRFPGGFIRREERFRSALWTTSWPRSCAPFSSNRSATALAPRTSLTSPPSTVVSARRSTPPRSRGFSSRNPKHAGLSRPGADSTTKCDAAPPWITIN